MEQTDKPVKKSSKKLFWGLMIAADAACLCLFAVLLFMSVAGRFSRPVFAALPAYEAERFFRKTAALFNRPNPALQETPEPVQAPPQDDIEIRPVPPLNAAAAPAPQPVLPPQQPVQPAQPAASAQPAALPQTAVVTPAEPERIEPEPAAVSSASDRQKARRVDLRFTDSGERKVLVAGSFSGWRPLLMQKRGHYWKTSVFVFPGKYRYFFVADGRRVLDPQADMEGKHSVFVVK